LRLASSPPSWPRASTRKDDPTALAYAYHDPYLLPLVTEERETRAIADVHAYRTDYPADWLERLTRLRAYVITCQESQKAADDLFGVKLAQYRK
jgi:hypothetical protein